MASYQIVFSRHTRMVKGFICSALITQHQSLRSVQSLCIWPQWHFTGALHISVNMVPSGCMHLSAMHLSAVLLYMCNASWLYLCILHFAHVCVLLGNRGTPLYANFRTDRTCHHLLHSQRCIKHQNRGTYQWRNARSLRTHINMIMQHFHNIC